MRRVFPAIPVLAMAAFAATPAAASCVVDGECDDGRFCNGAEICDDGACRTGLDPCPGRGCDDASDACVGNVALQPKLGQPLYGLTLDQRDRFLAGRDAFDDVFTIGQGLGPIFNQTGCGHCHTTPLGGSGSTTVTRFGGIGGKGEFDPLESLGGSLLQDNGIRPECVEIVPPEANLTEKRVTPSTIGLGLIEAIADATIEANAMAPQGPVSGRAHIVFPLESPATPRVGRMGWKAQVATVLTFSADAALNEMGLTNRFLVAENAPNGDAGVLADCDDVPDPEDGPDADGFDFVDRVTDFQRYLAQPPQTPRSGMSGEAIYESIGCADCHVAAFTTADDPLLEEALRARTIRPYSDFLLHDMGLHGDFIVQGDARQREVKTPPLWGLRVRDPIWHDGRFGGSFESRVRAAIAAHDALLSEAQAAGQAFGALPGPDQTAVLAFLDSLGKAEFDLTGDGLVGSDDYAAFLDCFSGPGATYTPDDACSIADPDQDGDVDEDDFDLFVAAADGTAGEVPAAAPGVPLTLDKADAGELALAWGGSCSDGDVDYAVYEGGLGDWTGHTPRACSTAGATEALFFPNSASAYYLIVPLNGFREGSYGRDSAGSARPPGAATCFPQSGGACE